MWRRTPYAAAALSNPETSHYLKATGYGFAVPVGATVEGIVVSVRHLASASTFVFDAAVKLVKAGAIGSTDKADTTNQWANTPATITYGSSTDLWGDTWTPSDVNDATFGVAFAAQTIGGSRTANVDHITVTVYYTTALTLTATAAM